MKTNKSFRAAQAGRSRVLCGLGVLVAATWLTASPVMAATVITNDAGEAIRIEKLEVGLDFYNVEWVSGEWDQVYGSEVGDFPFPDQRDRTEAAANAVGEALTADGNIFTINTLQDVSAATFYLPYDVLPGPGAPDARSWSVQKSNNEVPYLWGPANELEVPSNADRAYAVFRETLPPAVPVPAAVWLFGSGLLGLIGVARRRKA